VINMSLGGGAPSQIMADAIAYAHKNGVVVVCAAGNAARGVVEYPAAYPGAIAVSAIRADGALAPYSSWGKEVDIAAPGGDKSAGETGGILQNTIDREDPSRSVYAWYQGTSMAAPHVAGAAALLISAGAKTPDEVEKALFAGAEVHSSGWNDHTGHGILDVAASLHALKGEASPAASLSERLAAAPRSSTGESIFKVILGVLFGIGMAATLRKRERNPMGPALLVALTLSAAGIFFLPKPGEGMPAAGLLGLIELPIPDWGRWLFGPGRASPVFYSALIPLALSIVGYSWKGSRQVIAGVCLGFAAFMSYAVWSGAPAIAWMPLRFIAIPWLIVNVAVCLFLGRALIRKQA
jgi:serine protease